MTLLDYWQTAADEPLGLRILTPDQALLRQQLYRARAEVEGFEDITIMIPEGKEEVWLVKNPTSSS